MRLIKCLHRLPYAFSVSYLFLAQEKQEHLAILRKKTSKLTSPFIFQKREETLDTCNRMWVWRAKDETNDNLMRMPWGSLKPIHLLLIFFFGSKTIYWSRLKLILTGLFHLQIFLNDFSSTSKITAIKFHLNPAQKFKNKIFCMKKAKHLNRIKLVHTLYVPISL